MTAEQDRDVWVREPANGVAERPDQSGDLERRIGQVVAAASRRGMGDDQCERLRIALRVPCPPPGEDGRTGKGCGAPAGQPCRNMDGGELGRQAFHWFRGRNAGVTWEPVPERELRGSPKTASEATRARQTYENTGQDLPGYFKGKPWSPDGTAQSGGRW